ncbi:MAG: polar amino acid transport system substrate-binding protein [Paraglaciecola sp.]|jgi:polar amino acid transport system substrate-binding protein
MKLSRCYLNSCLAKSIICWILVFSSNLWADDGVDPAQTLRFAVVHVEEPPFIYTRNNSGYEGIVPNLAIALSRELALELEFLPTSRKGLEATIISGQADITWLSPEWISGKDQLIFSDPVLDHKEFLYSLNPLEEEHKPVDWVRGKTICVRQDYQYPSLKAFFNQDIAQAVRVSSQVPLITLLLGNRCDFLYMNEHRASWMLTSLSVSRKVFRSSKPLEQTHLAFMFNKTWQHKMSRINQALAKIKNSGELARIVQSQLQSTPSL